MCYSLIVELFYLFCIHSLSVLSLASQVFHTFSLQMVPGFTTQAFPQTIKLLPVVRKTVLKTLLSG